MLDFIAYKGLGRKRARMLRFKEQDGKCFYCGRQCHQNKLARNIDERNSWFVLDHKISSADGGNDMFSNLVGSCWLCNQKKGRRSVS